MKSTQAPSIGTRFWNRRHALKLLLAGASGSMVNGFCLEPARCRLTRKEICCPGLPGSLDGLRVGVLADFHFKPGIDEPLVEEALEILRKEKPDPERALRGIPPGVPIMALVHEPDFFDEMSAHRNLLQVSGHTHGGQCRVPFLDYAPAKVRYGRKYIQGSFSLGAPASS